MKKNDLFWVMLLGVWICCAATALAEEALPKAAGEVPAADAKVVPQADATAQPVELNADTIEYKPDEGKFVASGNVVLKQNNAALFCDRIDFFKEKQEAHAAGNVVLESDKGTVWADKGFYNFATKRGEFTRARVMAAPIFGYATTLTKVNEGYYILSDGWLSTSDYDDPEWRVRSRKIEVYFGDKAIARSSTMIIGGVPVFYMPKYTQDLRKNKPHIRVIPGYKKDFGAYLLTSYRVRASDRIETTYHLDYRERKDLAWGVDVKLEPTVLGQALLKTYYMNERNIQPKRIWDERAMPTTERERYRIEWRHQVSLDPATSLIAQYYKLSDADFLKTYFEREYRTDGAPATYALLTHNMAKATASLRADVRVNHFESIVERLPEATLSFANQPVGDTGFYAKSTNTVSRLVRKPASPSDTSERTARFDTDNEISRPFKVGVVEFRPYVGTEHTYYTRALDTSRNDAVRTVFRTGMDASTKFYRVFDVNYNRYGVEINRLRHVITPTVAYQFQHDPSLASGSLYQFDSIDNRAKIHQFILGLENKLQTKREGKNVDLARSVFSVPFRLKENPSSGSFGNAKIQNEIYPNEYVTFYTDAEYDNDRQHLQTANGDVYLTDKDRWTFGIGRRYTRDDDDILTSQLGYKLNAKWRTTVYERWNLDTGKTQEQEYVLTRDLHSWEVDFSFRQKNETDSAGSEVWIIFRLKAFPSVKVDGGSSFSQRRVGANGQPL